jgi:hypothetical protein
MVNLIASCNVLRDDHVRVALRTITVSVGLFVARASVAEPSEADRLYEEGKRLADAQDYQAACQRFEKSFELDHSPGIEVRLADCHEHLGHAVRAWHLFVDAARRWERAGDTRVGFARGRASSLESALAMVEIGVVEPELAGLEISINGEPVTPAAAVREAVAPGTVEIVATAPHRARFSRSREVRKGEVFVVEVKLGEPETRRRRSRVYTAVGLGATSIITGAVAIKYGFDARSIYHDAVNDPTHCDPGSPPQCDAIGQAKIDDSQKRAGIATGFAIATGALAATAVIVLWTAPRDVVVAPVVTAGGGGLSIAGHF